MGEYKLCGSKTGNKFVNHGCNKWKPMKEMFRCWECGIIMCEDCYTRHKKEHNLKKGGEK